MYALSISGLEPSLRRSVALKRETRRSVEPQPAKVASGSRIEG